MVYLILLHLGYGNSDNTYVVFDNIFIDDRQHKGIHALASPLIAYEGIERLQSFKLCPRSIGLQGIP